MEMPPAALIVGDGYDSSTKQLMESKHITRDVSERFRFQTIREGKAMTVVTYLKSALSIKTIANHSYWVF